MRLLLMLSSWGVNENLLLRQHSSSSFRTCLDHKNVLHWIRERMIKTLITIEAASELWQRLAKHSRPWTWISDAIKWNAFVHFSLARHVKNFVSIVWGAWRGIFQICANGRSSERRKERERVWPNFSRAQCARDSRMWNGLKASESQFVMIRLSVVVVGGK